MVEEMQKTPFVIGNKMAVNHGILTVLIPFCANKRTGRTQSLAVTIP